jgi:hypothetical protein
MLRAEAGKVCKKAHFFNWHFNCKQLVHRLMAQTFASAEFTRTKQTVGDKK